MKFVYNIAVASLFICYGVFFGLIVLGFMEAVTPQEIVYYMMFLVPFTLFSMLIFAIRDFTNS